MTNFSKENIENTAKQLYGSFAKLHLNYNNEDSIVNFKLDNEGAICFDGLELITSGSNAIGSDEPYTEEIECFDYQLFVEDFIQWSLSEEGSVWLSDYTQEQYAPYSKFDTDFKIEELFCNACNAITKEFIEYHFSNTTF